MRILHVITTLDPGGAEHHLLSLVRGQVLRGHEVSIVYLIGEGKMTDRFRAVGCREVTKVAFESKSDLIRCLMGIRRLVSASPAHLVHTHLLKANVLGGFASLGRCRIVASKHNDEHWLRRPVVSWVHGLASWMCDDQVVCLSDSVARFTHEFGRVPVRKITRVYYAFDSALYPSEPAIDVRREFGLQPESFIFGAVGRITKQKNQLVLVKAMARIKSAAPQARLLIVGAPDSASADYSRLVLDEVEVLGLEDVVINAGWRADAYRIIGGLDCLVQPSSWEGFGVVFLEALTQCVPVVATSVSAISEVVRDGVDGYLVPDDDAERLAQVMLDMIENHSTFRARLLDGGAEEIRDRFDLDRMVDETLEVYNTVNG